MGSESEIRHGEDLFREPPAEAPGEAELAPVEPGELEGVARIFTALVKAGRIIQLYPANNRIYQGAVGDLHHRFLDHLERYGELTLGIHDARIFYKRRPMYEDPDPLRSVPRRLFRDGIRQLSFFSGLEPDEILDFLQIVSRPPPLDDVEEDMVTLLWSADFTHIAYYVVEVHADDENLVRADRCSTYVEFAPSSPPDLAKSIRLGDEAERLGAQEGQEGGEVPPGPERVGARAPELRPSAKLAPASVSSIMTLTDHDQQTVREMLEQDQRRNLRHDLTTCLFELLQRRRDKESFEHSVRLLGLLLRTYIHGGGFREGAEVIRRLKAMLARGLPAEQSLPMEEELSRAWGEETMAAVGVFLEQPVVEHPLDLLEFFRELGPAALPRLIDLLPGARDERLVRQILQELSTEAPEHLFERLSDADPRVVRRIVSVLRATGAPDYAHWLAPLVDHPDTPTRLEVIGALGRMGGGEAREGLLRALRDSDPHVRVQAFRALEELGDPLALKRLCDLIDEKEFARRPEYERKQAFRTLTQIGCGAAVPFLTQLIDRKPFLKSARLIDLQVLAAEALGQIRSPGVREILDRRLNRAHGRLAEALRESLRRLEANRAPAAEEDQR